MSDVLNYYLQKYGVIENQKEDTKIDSNEKARDRWNMLRKSIGSASDLLEKHDLRDNKISHGIQFVRRISHVNEIEQAFYIANTDSYLTLDGCSLRVYDCNGRYKNFLAYSDIVVPFRRLEYAYSNDRFVAWTPYSDDLAMLNLSFELVEKVDINLVNGAIIHLFYNEDRNEIVSFHSSHWTMWQFRYANKHLIPRLSVSLDTIITGGVSSVLTVERTSRSNQRLFLADECSVSVLETSQGALVGRHCGLHECPITAMTFFNPLKLLVTGAKDGSIKVWSSSLCRENDQIALRMVFVGHTGGITSLSLFPSGGTRGCQATIASCGMDKSLRVWSLELDDELECVDLEYRSRAIAPAVHDGAEKLMFFTMGSNFIDLWNQNQVADDLMSFSSPVVRLHRDDQWFIGCCKNNLLFLMAPTGIGTDQIITKTVLKDKQQSPGGNRIISTVCLTTSDTLLVLMQDNRILHYNTRTHPMVLVSSSQYGSSDPLVVLTAYRQPNKALILSGSSRGLILVHDLGHLETTTFQVEAHSESPVACLISDPSNNRLFSSGHDKTIKVWRVYPFASEPLSKILSFFCGLLPSHLVSLDNYLFTVFCDSSSAQYPTVVYKLDTRARHDHSPTDDHIEPINSVSVCRRMKLFLSSSSGTENLIKIWTCKNVLLRQIEIHFPIHYVTFCSDKADMLAAIDHQICLIEHTKYLPKIYRKKQALMHFDGPAESMEESEEAFTRVEFDDQIFQKHFSAEDQQKLIAIRPVSKFHSYTDVLSPEEADEISKARKRMQENYDRLRAVEADIAEIRDGNYDKSAKKQIYHASVKSKAFKTYFSHIVKCAPTQIAAQVIEETDDESTIKKSSPDKYRKQEKQGFFPAHDTINRATAPDNIRQGGFIPNSTVLRALWPVEVLKEKAEAWRPPVLSKLDLLCEQDPVKQAEEESDFFDWGMADDNLEPEPEDLEGLSDDLVSKFGSLLADDKPSESLREESSLDVAAAEPAASTDSTSTTAVEPKRPSAPKTLMRANLKLPPNPAIKKSKPASESRKVRFVSPTSQEESSGVESRTDTVVFITEVPPTQQSVLPSFVARFSSESWFLVLCPPPHHDPACLQRLPSPLTAGEFALQISRLVTATASAEHVCDMIRALGSLCDAGSEVEGQHLTVIHLAVESKIHELVRIDSELHLRLFKLCLDLLALLLLRQPASSSRTVLAVCFSHLLDPELDSLKSFLESILCRLGLNPDTVAFVSTKLGTDLKQKSRPTHKMTEELRQVVTQWLDKWFQRLVEFAIECRAALTKESHLIDEGAHLSISTATCLQAIKTVFQYEVKSSADLVRLSGPDRCAQSLLTHVCGVRYFEFVSRQQDNSKGEKIGTRKTVVSLPRLDTTNQCLVRLGESHADILKVRTSRKTVLNMNVLSHKQAITDHTQHPSMQPFHHYQVALGGGFVPFMHLHLKPCLVNPFPCIEDITEWQLANPKSLFANYYRTFLPRFSLPPEPF